MSILTQEDRKDLVYAMRVSLLEQVRSGVLTESKKAAAENFILNEGTYEQLLNLAFNPNRDTDYKPTEVLEKVAMESYSKVLQELTSEEVAQAQKDFKANISGGSNEIAAKAQRHADLKASLAKNPPKQKTMWHGFKKAVGGGRNAKIAAGVGAAGLGLGVAYALKKRREKQAAAAQG